MKLNVTHIIILIAVMSLVSLYREGRTECIAYDGSDTKTISDARLWRLTEYYTFSTKWCVASKDVSLVMSKDTRPDLSVSHQDSPTDSYVLSTYEDVTLEKEPAPVLSGVRAQTVGVMTFKMTD